MYICMYIYIYKYIYACIKRTLMRPGLTTISEIPVIPWRRISSASENASCSGTPSGTISSSLSLDTTIKMSTWTKEG